MPQGGVPEGEGVHPIFAQPTPPTTAQPSVPTPASTSTSAKEEEGRARTRSGDGSRSAKFSSFFKTSSSSTSSQNAPAAATTATAPPTATAPSGVTGVPAAATVVSVASPGTIPSLPTATVLATSQPSNASQSAPTVPRERSRTASTPPVPVPVAVEHHVRRRSSSTTSATAEERWMEFLWKERRRIPEDPKMHGPPDMRACTVLPQFYADFDGEDQYSFGRSASFDLSTQSTAPPLRRVRSVGDFRHTSAAVGWRHFVDHHLEALDARFAVHPGTTDHDAVQEDARAAQQLNGDWLASADGHRVSGEGAQRRGSRRGSERDTNSHREEMRALLERGKASMQTARAKLSAFKQRHLGGHQIKDFLFTDESSTSSRSQHGQSSPTPRPTAAPTPASPSVNDSSNQPQTAARPRPSLNSASSAKRPSLTGTDTAEGGSASSAMKYVASIFRSTGGGAGDNNDSERRRSVLRPPTGAEDESGSVAGGGGEGKTRMKDMLSKAFSSVR